MKTRRHFLQAALASAAFGPYATHRAAAWAQPSTGKLTFGVQLFEVRRTAATDLPRALNMIAEAGFPLVELYPIAYSHPAAQLREMIGAAGLGCVSGHFDYSARATSVEYAHTLGLKYIICANIPKDQGSSPEGLLQTAEHFSGWGKEAMSAGLQFAFHNGNAEFAPLTDASHGANGFDVLMKNTDPALVKLELDLYWLTQAGQDPAAMLRRYSNRAALVHMQDRTANAPTGYATGKESQHFVEMGKGAIDWPALLRQARAQGIQYAFLDQDETALPLEQSLRESQQYLSGLGI